MKKIILIVFVATSCRSTKTIPNYKNDNGELKIWRYTKPGELNKTIFSTGDTLVSTKDTLYIIRKSSS